MNGMEGLRERFTGNTSKRQQGRRQRIHTGLVKTLTFTLSKTGDTFNDLS